jgi:hypothetical protein
MRRFLWNVANNPQEETVSRRQKASLKFLLKHSIAYECTIQRFRTLTSVNWLDKYFYIHSAYRELSFVDNNIFMVHLSK